MDGYIGEIRLVAFGFAPQDWAFCNGQILSISQYGALFSLIGKIYGGDGQTTFALPDLRGRFATSIGTGQIPSNPSNVLGDKGGTSGSSIRTNFPFQLSPDQLPNHTHTATFTGTGGGTPVQPTITVKVSNDPATSAAPLNNGYIGTATTQALEPIAIYSGGATGTTTLNSATATASGGSGGGITGGTVAISPTGSGAPINIPATINIPPAMPPFLVLNYIICLMGSYPSRP